MKKNWFTAIALCVAIFVPLTTAAIVSASGSTKRVAHPPRSVTSVAANQLWPGRKLSLPARDKFGRKVLGYQWFRCNRRGSRCVKIRGARHRYYVIRRVDVGHSLRADIVTLSGVVTTSPTPVVGHGKPKNTVVPALTDDGAGGGTLAGPVVGDNLGGDSGTWSEAVHYTYQWFDCVPTGVTPPTGFVATATLDGLQCAGGTGNTSPSAQTTSSTAPTYPLTDTDVGFDIVLEVTAFNT